MKKQMMMAAASVAAWCSWGAESITVKEVANHYPWDGKVDCVYTLSGMENWRSYEGAFELSVKKDGVPSSRSVTRELANVDGIYTNTFDCTVLFGAGYYPNGGIAVKLVKKIDGVQLWKDGPYFATCNVGATKPQDSGYYFWWGDTVGYKRNAANNGWNAVDGEQTGFQFSSSNSKIVTYGKTVSQLTSGGYVDSMTNLVAKYDAATAHWSAPWRLMTVTERAAFFKNCTTTWTDNWNGTGVKGRVVTGKGDYASKSIFLPAAGVGTGATLDNLTMGYYWCATPDSTLSCPLIFFSSGFTTSAHGRIYGMTVRPVRSAE